MLKWLNQQHCQLYVSNILRFYYDFCNTICVATLLTCSGNVCICLNCIVSNVLENRLTFSKVISNKTKWPVFYIRESS